MVLFNLGEIRLCTVFMLFSIVSFGLSNDEHTLTSDDDSGTDIPVIEGFGEPVTIAEENEVLILTNENFHHVVRPKDVILVEFYAPWCGHCKAFEPEYASAAKELKKDGIRIAKVDATVEVDLAKEFEITGYPTIKLFKKGEPVEEFDGTRTASGIIEYMKIKADPNYKPEPSSVKVLTAANFSSFVNSEKLSLVEFYAPWCGHCKRLAPEYDGAAKDLIASQIPLAKVDATTEPEVSKEYNVQGYPKLLIFRHGRSFDFNGPRERAGIVRYMQDQAKIPSSFVSTVIQAKNRVPRTDSYVFAYFDEKNNMYEEYIAAANELREECIFLHTFDGEVAKTYGVISNSIDLVFPEIYHSDYENPKTSFTKLSANQAEISSWISDTIVPLVGERSRSNMAQRYTKRPLLVVYYDVNFSHQHFGATQFIRNKILAVAHKHKDIIFAISNEEEFEDELKSLGLEDSGEDVNVAIFGEKNLKYKMEPEEDFSSQMLEEFVLKYEKGKLKPHMKSQPIPKRQEGPVRIIVAETFEKEVLRSDKDVLIEFYAPWCGHCKKLEPVYKKVAKHFSKERPNILVAKMDASANDVHPNFAVQGFPTIFLVKASDKDHPVPFEGGDRTFSGFKGFVEEHLMSTPSREEL